MKTFSGIRWASSTFLAIFCLTDSGSLRAAECLAVCSPTGTHYVTAVEQGRIEYCAASNGQIQGTFYICHPAAISFSENGQLLVAAGGKNGSPATIKAWRLKDRQQLCEIFTGGAGVKILALSSDGRLVAGASADGRLEVWSVRDGQLQWSRTMSGPVQSIRFLFGTKTLLITSDTGGEHQFDADTGRRVANGREQTRSDDH